jgi:ribosomal protein L37E
MTIQQSNISCARCSRKWYTKSNAYRVKCAHCGYSTPNPNFKGIEQAEQQGA